MFFKKKISTDDALKKVLDGNGTVYAQSGVISVRHRAKLYLCGPQYNECQYRIEYYGGLNMFFKKSGIGSFFQIGSLPNDKKLEWRIYNT